MGEAMQFEGHRNVHRAAAAPGFAAARRTLATFVAQIGCRLVATIALAAGSLAGAQAAETTDAQAGEIKRILLVEPYHNRFPATVVVSNALRERVLQFAPRTEIYEDFLDLVRFPSEDHLKLSAAFLANKYSDRKIDLLVALGPDSLKYVAKYGALIAPHAKVIFCGIARETLETIDFSQDIKGVVSELSATRTLELARNLQPATRKVVVIVGVGEIDSGWESKVRAQFAAYEKDLQFMYLVGTPKETLLKTVAALPRDTIVIMLSVFRDTTGRSFIPRDVTAEVTKASAAPVYGPYDTYLTADIVGGFMDTFESVGRSAGDLALATLAGRETERIVRAPTEFRVDARQLERWGLSESRLPAGTTVLFRTPSLWEQHRNTVIAALALFVFQSLIIALLIIQMRLRAHAETSLKESEARTILTQGRLQSVERRYEKVLGELGQRLIALQEEERRRIASELHDSTGQHLVAIDLYLMKLRMLAENFSDADKLFDQIQASLDEALRELRVFTYLLYPPDLAKDGLKAAIERYVIGFSQRAGLAARLRLPDTIDELPYAVQRSILRIVQEALGNVHRHACATRVNVRCTAEHSQFILQIRDNGRGMSDERSSSELAQPGVGIPGMQARVREFGGDLKIFSGKRGTTLVAEIPLADGTMDAQHPTAEVCAPPALLIKPAAEELAATGPMRSSTTRLG